MAETPDAPGASEIEAARREPRLDHDRAAVIADWRAAMNAAERARRLADWGLQMLLDSEAAEERELDAESHTASDNFRTQGLAAARVRAALAAAE